MSARAGALVLNAPALSLKTRAVAWLAQREHSRAELRRKLLEFAARQRKPPGDAAPAAGAALGHGVAPDAEPEAIQDHPQDRLPDTEREVDALLDSLSAKGLLSDERFAESRINTRASRYGNRRIRQELSQHGVTLDAETSQALQATELERARAVWTKRYGGPATDAAGRARQARFLAARGFSVDVVRRVVAGRADPE